MLGLGQGQSLVFSKVCLCHWVTRAQQISSLLCIVSMGSLGWIDPKCQPLVAGWKTIIRKRGCYASGYSEMKGKIANIHMDEESFLVMSPGQKFLTRVRSCQFFVARVGSGQPFMVWVWISKISPKTVKFSNFFPLDKKKLLRVGSESTRVEAGSASYLLQVKSKLGSGQGPSLELWLTIITAIFLQELAQLREILAFEILRTKLWFFDLQLYLSVFFL